MTFVTLVWSKGKNNRFKVVYSIQASNRLHIAANNSPSANSGMIQDEQHVLFECSELELHSSSSLNAVTESF